MRLLFYLVPMLLLQWFTASFAAGVTNITVDQSALLAFKAYTIDRHNVLNHNWSIFYQACIGFVFFAVHAIVELLP